LIHSTWWLEPVASEYRSGIFGSSWRGTHYACSF